MATSSIQEATSAPVSPQQFNEEKRLFLPHRGEELYTAPLQALGIRLVKECDLTTAYLPRNWTIRNISKFDPYRENRDVFVLKDDKTTPRVVCMITNMFRDRKLEVLVLNSKQQQSDEDHAFRLFINI